MSSFKPNASKVDRGIRAVLAVACIYLGFVHPATIGDRMVAYLVGAFGALNLFVVILGWCPIYALTGVCTLKKR